MYIYILLITIGDWTNSMMCSNSQIQRRQWDSNNLNWILIQNWSVLVSKIVQTSPRKYHFRQSVEHLTCVDKCQPETTTNDV